MITYKEFLTEKEKVYQYGCSMLYFDFPEISVIHDGIDPSDIYEKEGFGLELEPHCTLLYGIHTDEVDDDEVISLSKFDSKDPIILKNISIFENGDYEVLKFDAFHPDLKSINKKLRDLPYTNEHENYHPHSTIAYLKTGKSGKYIKAYEGRSFKVYPKHIVYSKPDGSKIKKSPK